MMLDKLLFLCINISFILLNYVLCTNGEKGSWGTARLEYFNPDYTTNCSVVTFKSRDKNGESLTNITINLLYPMGNNITIGATIESNPGDRMKLDYKFCAFFKQPWILTFLQRQEMKMPWPCPVPPGRIFLSNLNLPPTNMPIPLQMGRYKILLELYRTNDQKQIMLFIIEGKIVKKNGKQKHKSSM